MLKNFNKLPKQPKYFNIYNSYHSMFTWPIPYFPSPPAHIYLKAGIAHCTNGSLGFNGAGRILTFNSLFYLVHEEQGIMH
jgi:hypothetical protein